MSGLINVIRKGAKKPIQLFSRVDEAAQELPRTKGTGKEFMAELKKQPGVKKAELDDRKLAELESAPKMTKQEFIDKLKEKPAAKIEEDIKANPTDADLDAKAMELIEQKADEMAERKFGKIDRFNRYEWNDYQEGAVAYLKDREYDKYLREAKRDIEENGGVSFPRFTDPTLRLPGGENYREILLRLPNTPKPVDYGSKEFREAAARQYGEKYVDSLSQAQRDLVAKKMQGTLGKDFTSKHWEEPNVLAHMRVQDRVGPNGEKILHVEEIQSDWHQAGRQQGYKGQSGDERLASVAKPMNGYFEVLDQNGNFIANVMNHDLPAATSEAAIAEAQRRIQSPRIGHQADDPRVPDAPFKKNWHELATKKLMNYAIENGYDKVAFTPAVEQVRRYEDATRKVVDEIAYNPSTGYFTAMKDGRVVNNQKMDPETLEKTVGKQTAQNLLASEPNNIGIVSMKSKDMTIGGELYKNLYDRDIVNFLNKEYGKYGVQVEMFGHPEKLNSGGLRPDPQGIHGFTEFPPEIVNLHSFNITPEMREAIEAKGQPLYQTVGVGLTGAAAVPDETQEQPEFRRGGRVNLSDNPDTMMLELLSRRK